VKVVCDGREYEVEYTYHPEDGTNERAIVIHRIWAGEKEINHPPPALVQKIRDAAVAAAFAGDY
jgi:hypothetical protein